MTIKHESNCAMIVTWFLNSTYNTILIYTSMNSYIYLRTIMILWLSEKHLLKKEKPKSEI